MSDKRYNGWRNRETWNAHLWLSNDEGMYLAARDAVKGQPNRIQRGHAIRDFCFDLWPSRTTPDGDSLHRITDFGWQDIAAAFAE